MVFIKHSKFNIKNYEERVAIKGKWSKDGRPYSIH